MAADPESAAGGSGEGQPPPAGRLDAASWPVRTARLLLRPATAADAEPTWRYRRLPAVGHWLTSAPATFEEYREAFCHPSRLAKSLVAERDGTLIADLMATVEDAWAQADVAEQARGVQAELGWVMDPAAAGQGYATEAVRELIRICFAELGLRRVTASCFAGNEASWRLMERVGMRREFVTVREALHRTEGWVDGYGYALLADEWAGTAGDRPGQPAGDRPGQPAGDRPG